MTRHDTISPNLESFILLAVSDAIEKHVTVFSSTKSIQPLDHSKSDEIEFILVSDFIIATQGKFDWALVSRNTWKKWEISLF